MYIYNYRIYDRYRKPVVSLAILADERETWRPDRYREELWGWYVEMGFPTVKLLDYRERIEALEENSNPFAVIVAAHLTTQETRRDGSLRYEGKLRIAKSLYRRGYSRQDIMELFRLIDWMVNLPEAAEQEFNKEIQDFEEENQMPYITSVERLARQEGLSQGIAEGISQGISQGIIQKGREDVIEVLEVRFQEVPTEVIQRVNEIEDPALLKTLLREAIALESVEQFLGYLQSIGS
jgi:flagellar biosynthesis/type III secretory pathway protein FliH